MITQPKAHVGYARMRLTIRKSWFEEPNNKKTEREETMASERTLLIEDLCPDSQLKAANIAMSTNSKVSESVYWGDGAWDKVPFSVEVFSSVSLCCPQTESAIKQAQELAYDLAWESSREAIGKALIEHTEDIRTRLFPELFDE
jgi:hypothetical protein